jgi:hypothetical protein
MQVKIIKLLFAFPDIKIVVEKPIVTDQIINQEILELFSKQSNLFISRPWNFSQLWLNFKENLLKIEYLNNIKVTHGGDIVRQYISPAQDWLHHDICLIEDLKLKPNYIIDKKVWSNGNKNLHINIGDSPSIEIEGGYSQERISIFEVFFQDGLTVKMDMNNRNLSIEKLDKKLENFVYVDDLPINSMIERFIKTEINEVSKNHELKILQELQILSI